MKNSDFTRRDFISIMGIAGVTLLFSGFLQSKNKIADTSWDLTKLDDFYVAICNPQNIEAFVIMANYDLLTAGNYVYTVEDSGFKQVNYIGTPNQDDLKQELDRNYELVDFIPLKPQLISEFPANTEYTIEEICSVVLKIQEAYKNKQTEIDMTLEEYEALKEEYEALKAKYELAREKYEENEEEKGQAYTKRMWIIYYKHVHNKFERG